MRKPTPFVYKARKENDIISFKGNPSLLEAKNNIYSIYIMYFGYDEFLYKPGNIKLDDIMIECGLNDPMYPGLIFVGSKDDIAKYQYGMSIDIHSTTLILAREVPDFIERITYANSVLTDIKKMMEYLCGHEITESVHVYPELENS